MFSQKSILTMTLLPFYLFSQSSHATETSFSSKYTPYIGVEHGYASESGGRIKYMPRLFTGVMPFKTERYHFGLEIGYTLPAAHEDSSTISYWGEKTKLRTVKTKEKNADLSIVMQQPITQNIYWFLKPSLEYAQDAYHISYNNDYVNSGHNNGLSLSGRAGIGYKFNNGLGLNFLAKSQLHSFSNAYTERKLSLKVNAVYTF